MKPERALELVQQYQNGDKNAAWVELEPVLVSVVSLIARKINVPGFDSEDLQQELLVLLCEKLETLELDIERGTLQGWAYTVAWGTAVNMLAKKMLQRRRANTISLDRELADNSKVFHNTLKAKPNLEPSVDNSVAELDAVLKQILSEAEYSVWLRYKAGKRAKHNTPAYKQEDNAITRLKVKLRKYLDSNVGSFEASDFQFE